MNDFRLKPGATVAAALLVALLACGYRYLSHGGYSNDHFIHLARAQAMLAGDLPIRDYTEEAVPLTVLLSAGAQMLFGDAPFAEMILVLASLAVAAGVTCWLTAELTGSIALGVLAGVLQIVVWPRLYSHPKMLVYPVLLLSAWYYLRAPGRGRLLLLAVWTTIAFLLRHDHGLYAGIGAVATIAVAHWKDGFSAIARSGIQFAVLTIACLAPYLVYVQYYQGLFEYVRVARETGASESGLGISRPPDFAPLPAGPWVTQRPAELADIRVRWREGVDDRQRRDIEQRFALLEPEFDDGRTWKYRVEPDAARLRALIALHEAEDTGGLDRSSGEIEDRPSVVGQAARWLERIDPGPPLVVATGEQNLSAALSWTVWLLPLVTLVILAVARHRSAVTRRTEILVVVVVVLVCSVGFLRDPFPARVPDVYGSVPILFAWVVAAAWGLRPAGRFARVAASGVIVAATVAFVIATALLGQIGERARRTGVTSGPSALWQRARTVTGQMREWPWPSQWPTGEGWRVARYVHDCTGDRDRLLVTWNAPEMYVFSRRAFAGGETLLVPVRRPPQEFEGAVVSRLERQSVPIVLVQSEGFDRFRLDYPAVTAWLDNRYRQGGTFSNPGEQINVLVEKDRNVTSTDREYGLPCFTGP